MSSIKLKCDVCRSDIDVKNLGSIYTYGSEGTNLCIQCRIAVSNMLKGMVTASRTYAEEMLKKTKK